MSRGWPEACCACSLEMWLCVDAHSRGWHQQRSGEVLLGSHTSAMPCQGQPREVLRLVAQPNPVWALDVQSHGHPGQGSFGVSDLDQDGPSLLVPASHLLLLQEGG